MFANPSWFQREGSPGIVRFTWRGWIYCAAAALLLVIPHAALQASHKTPEAFIWLAAVGAMLLWEFKSIRTQIRTARAEEDIFVIDDDKDVTRLKTDKYDLELRDR